MLRRESPLPEPCVGFLFCCYSEPVAELWIEGIPLQRCHGGVLRVLAKAEERAAWAERRLRSRLIELTWPATLGAFTGGFAAVVALRLAGM